MKLSLKAPPGLPGLQIHQRSGRSNKPACIATSGSALTCCGSASGRRLLAAAVGAAGRSEHRHGQGLGIGRRAPKPATQRRVADVLGLGFEDLKSQARRRGRPAPVGAAGPWLDPRRSRRTVGTAAVHATVEEGLELPPDPRKMARVYRVSQMELAAGRVGGR